jgi:hypothetical protein
MVEVVGVLIVAQQHGIHVPYLIGCKRRGRQLRQRHLRQAIFARRIEGRIGQQAKAAEFNQRGRTADQGDRQWTHARAPRFLRKMPFPEDRCGEIPQQMRDAHVSRASFTVTCSG